MVVVTAMAQNPRGIVAGQVQIKLKPAASETVSRSLQQMTKSDLKPGELRTGIVQLDAVTTDLKAIKMTRVFPDAGAYEAKQRKYDLHLWYKVDIDPSLNIPAAVSKLKQVADLETASPVYEVVPITPFSEMKKTVVSIPQGSKINVLGGNPQVLGMNDPGFGLQWHYENTGQAGGYADVDIDLEDAWKINAGRKEVIVAIVDQGVDYNHVDLKDNMWVNSRELNGTPGVDDDGNGYVDDIYGYNFAGYNGSISPGDHGTHVAGTVSATNNNGRGVSGVAGGTGKGDGVRIMSTQIFGDNSPNTAAAIVYGANNGAIISQNSWGYTQPGYQDQAVNAAIDYFINEAGRDANGKQVGLMNGGIVIFAAGNSNTNSPMYPGANPAVLAVGATNVFDNKAGYSNYGPHVDISAPGGETSVNSARGVLSTVLGDQYAYFQGTSMACPHVSGVAALIVSQFGKPGYTPTDLRNRMLATVDNFVAMSPEFLGQMGIGRLNAGKALQPDKGIAPAAITNLTGVGTTQTRIDLSWTAPLDDDNGKSENYKVYYSTQPFDSTQLGLARVIALSLDSAKAAGLPENWYINNLLASTTYYISVQSRDLWGNASRLSNQAMVATKPGPTTVIASDTIRMNINVATDPKATASFTLVNNGGGEMYAKNSIVPIRSTWARATGYNDTLMYFNTTSASIWIGDDQPIPFSAATKYIVPANRTTAFTLTHIANSMRRQTVTDSVVMMVYRGGNGSPAEGKLIHRQNVWIPTTGGRMDHYKLNGMYAFQPGETFWIVFEYSEKFAYSQGSVNITNVPKENFQYSSNRGQTWGKIADAYGREVAWMTWAESNEGMISSFISVTPDTSVVAPAGSQLLNLSANASKMRNGTYYLRAQSENNDISNQFASKPLVVTISGQPAVLSSRENVMDMGKPFLSQFSENSVWLYNIGLNTLTSFTVTSSNPRFATVTVPTSIVPGDSAQLKLRFTPLAAGYQTADLTVNSNGGSIKISATGVGLEPPVLQVRDTTVYFSAMVDSSATRQFTVSNKNGKYPLSFSFPAIAAMNKPNALSLLAKGVDANNAYEWIDNREVGGPLYNWYDISKSGKNISAELMNASQMALPFDLGFTMNYYGDTVKSLYITNQGMLSVGFPAVYNTGGNVMPNKDNLPGVIAPLFMHVTWGGITDRDKVKVYVQREPGRMIVQWEDMMYTTLDPALGFLTTTTPSTFQAIVYSDGHFEFNYKIVGNWVTKGAIIGLESKDQTKGFNLHQNYSTFALKSGASIWIVPVAPQFVNKAVPLNTVVPAGEEVVVSLTASAKGLRDSVYKSVVRMTTNDPLNASVNIPVQLTVTGTQQMAQQTNQIDFGTIPNGDKKTIDAILYNAGSKAVKITAISSNNPVFSSKMITTTIAPYSQVYIPVEFAPNSLGATTGTLTVTTDFAPQQVWTFNLNGEATAPAAITWSMTGGQNQTLNVGDSLNATLTINNTGTAPLKIALEHPYWLNVNAPRLTTGFLPGQHTYSLHKNVDGQTRAGYQWQSYASGVGQETIIDATASPYQRFTLPFNFPFYGKNYRELNMSYKASLFFGDTVDVLDQVFTTIDPAMPNAANPNGIITLGHAHFLPLQDVLNGGKILGASFYYADAEKAVITYDKMINYVFGNSGNYTMQAVLYKDGRIKTQYADGQNANTLHQLVYGIENESGSDGVTAYHKSYWLKNGSVIEYIPSKMLTIEPGQSATVPLTWLTKEIGSGTFKDSLVLITNDPLNKTIQVPIQLQIGSSIVMAMADTLNYGDIIAHKPTTAWNPYSKSVDLENKGTTPYTITGITFSKAALITSLDATRNQVSPPFTMMPGDKVSLFVRIRPDTTAPYLPKFKEVMRIATNIPNFKDSVILTANVFFQPYAVQDSTLFAMTLQRNQDATRSFVISDTGRGPLSFDGVVNYRRNGVKYQSEGEGEKVELGAEPIMIEIDGSKVQKNNMALMAPYTDSLMSYDPTRTDYLRYGSATSDVATFLAMRHVTGSKGMNLQYVRVGYFTERDTEIDLKIRIRVGINVNTSTVLQQTVKHLPSAVNGRILDLKLDSAILLYPNEPFFIEVEYPENLKHPQLGLLYPLSQLESSSFFHKTRPTDNFLASAVSYKPILAALEETDIESGWLKVTPALGTVAAKGSLPVKLDVVGSKIIFKDEIADLLINTNDPVKKTLGVRVQVHIDQAPYFLLNDTLVVREGDTLRSTLALADDEGGTVSASLTNPVSNASIAKQSDGTYRFEYRPTYTEAGIRSFAVKLSDDKNNSADSKLIVKVINSNRAPVATTLTERIVTINQPPLVIDLKTVFTEPDGEKMTFKFLGDSTPKATVSMDNNGMASINGLIPGQVSLYFSATDPFGLSTVVTQPIKVISNRAPVSKAEIPDQYIEMHIAPRTLKLDDYFVDMDGDAMTYTVSIDSAELADVTVNGNELSMIAKRPGVTVVSVTATDSKGATYVESFVLTVLSTQGNIVQDCNITVGPNPFRNQTTIRFVLGSTKNVRIDIVDMMGRVHHVVFTGSLNAGAQTISPNLSTLAAGNYLFRFTIDGKQGMVQAAKL